MCSEAGCRADGVYTSRSLQIRFSKLVWKTGIPPLKKIKDQDRKRYSGASQEFTYCYQSR